MQPVFSPIHLVLILGMGLSSTMGAAMADDLDATSLEALQKTQQLLSDPSAREEESKRDPNAKKAIENVKGLGLSAEDQQKVFQLSSEIFGGMVKESKGNVIEMNSALEKAMRDPASFYQHLTPEQRKQIEGLSFGLTPPATPKP